MEIRGISGQHLIKYFYRALQMFQQLSEIDAIMFIQPGFSSPHAEPGQEIPSRAAGVSEAVGDPATMFDLDSKIRTPRLDRKKWGVVVVGGNS